MNSTGDVLADAFARHRNGDRAAAEKLYRKVIKAQPGNPDALYLLGMLCLEDERPADAAGFLKRAVAALGRMARAVDPGWQLALGTALQRSGDAGAALAAFEAALRADPASVDALFCQATALQDLGRGDEAVAAYEAVLAQNPKHAEAANNLGTLHRERGAPRTALAAFRRAVAARPGYTEAVYNLGNALADAGAAAEAVTLLTAAADARPADVDLHMTLFDCLVQADRADEAERRARAFLESHPGSAPVAAALGMALQYLGRAAEARSAFLSAIAADPGCARAHQGLADDPEEGGRDGHIRALEAALAAAPAGAGAEAGLYYALGRHLAVAGRHRESLDAYARANALKGETLVQRGYGYDRARMERQIERIMDAFPAGGFTGPGGSDSTRPLFVLGMPRSGTTLTEQILASHPQVFGAGELPLMGQIAERLWRGPPGPAAMLSGDALAQGAAFYLAAIGRLDDKAARVTDKMPANFLYLGLIARLFPKARIVHCRRNPADTCLSCFQQNFRAAHLAWSCDLADLGHYYCQYHGLMAHWRQVLPPGTMLEVDYEDTVADLEGQARRLVDFAGLDWDDACLRFHQADRSVITASHSQVRRQVYATSVGRWQRYGDGLRPLFDALSACGCAPEAAP